MKKLLVFALAIMLCLTFGMTAMAAEDILLAAPVSADAPPLLIAPNPNASVVWEWLNTGDTANGDLPMASVRSVLVDSFGNLLVGSNGGGLSIKLADQDGFTSFSVAGDFELGSDVVQSLAMDDKGGVWISQAKTYNPMQASLNKGAAYFYNGEYTYFDTSTPGTIPHDYVQDIEIDAKGRVWFGSFGGLTCYDPAAGTWRTYTTADGMPATSVDAIAFDSKGGTWYGCYPASRDNGKTDPFVGGFGYINAEGEHVWSKTLTGSFVTNDIYTGSLISEAWIRDIEVDAQDGVWVICSGSYDYLPNQGGTLFYVDSDFNVKEMSGKEFFGDKLTGNSEVRCVAIDDAGTVWFGTWNGVYAFDWVQEENRCFSAANGDWLTDSESKKKHLDQIYSLDIYDGVLYIGSEGGVHARSIEIAEPLDTADGIYMSLDEGKSDRAVVNGKAAVLDAAPMVIDGTTFVPVRFITENLGLINNWSADKPSVVSLQGQGFDIELNIDSKVVTVNGEAKELSVAPFVKDNRTMVPLRFISETLMKNVNWNKDYNSVIIK